MAAPANEFIQKKIGDMTNSTTKLCDVGVYDANVATLKTRYYLDFVRGVVEYDANLNELPSKSGFIGGCIIGSDNYYMHNQARIWSVGALTASNEVLYNDAGKNTKGIVASFINMLRHANYATFSALYKSSWHSNTTSFGIRHRKLGASSWNTDVHGTSIAQRQQLDVPRYLIRWGYAKNDTVQFEAYIANEEGTFYFPTKSAVMLSPLEEYITEVRTVVCTATTNRIKIWMIDDDFANLDLIPEAAPSGDAPTVIFYTDPERTIRVGAGFYAGLKPNKVFVTDSTGKVAYWHNCPVTPVYIYVNLRAFVNFEDSSISSIEISISEPVSFAIRVQGRCDNNPTQGNQFGKAFDLTIPIGQKKATDNNFNLQRNPPNALYYFLNVSATPTGQNIQVIYNSTI